MKIKLSNSSLLLVLIGCLMLVVQPVQAKNYVTSATNLQVSSGNTAVPLYSDADCTQPTGATLSTKVNKWQVFAIGQASPADNAQRLSYKLGAKAWVKSSDVFLGGVVKNQKPNNLLEAYSNYQRVPIYDSPQLWHITGYLNSNIADWKVSKYASNSATGNPITRVDLGANQWVDTTNDVIAVRSLYIFEKGTPLFNQFGIPTDKIQTDDFYKVYGIKTINGQNYVKLGTNKQWANLSEAHTN